MKAFPNFLAASVALLAGAFLAPAASSAGVVVLALVLGTVWMGAVWTTLDRRSRHDDEGRVPVRIRCDRDREHDRRRR